MTVLEPGIVIAGYRVDSVIGQGGMGVVYKATHLTLDRAVALKVIKPGLASEEGFRKRFERESRLAASLHHPRIVTIYDAREEQGLVMIVMQYVDGTDLRRVIEREEQLEPSRAVSICDQVASALDAAHRHALVHRDVKPANILLGDQDGTETAYLSDFGLGKLISSESDLTSAGMLVGTLDYLAPELIQGQRIDGRCDVYSLGCVLFQALSGRVPYPTDHHVAKIWAHIESPPPSVLDAAPDLPGGLEDVLRRAMAKDPPDRYPTAGEFCREATRVVEMPAAVPRTAGPSREHAARPSGEPPVKFAKPQLKTTAAADGADMHQPPGAGEPTAPPPGPARAPAEASGGTWRKRRPPVIAAAGVIAVLLGIAVALVALTSGSDGGPTSGPADEESTRRTAPAGEQRGESESSRPQSEETDRTPGTAQGLPLGGLVPHPVAAHAGPFVHRARRNQGLTLDELSHTVHLSKGQHPQPHSLEHLEDGQRATLPMYLRLADVLGLSASRMLDSEVPSRPSARSAAQAAHHVRSWRQGRGLTPAELAENLYRPDGRHYSPRLVAEVERGVRAPLVAYLTIARVTGIKPSELLGTRLV